MSTFSDIPGIGPALEAKLAEIGITDLAALATAETETLTQLRGVTQARADAFRAEARVQMEEGSPAPAAQPDPVAEPVSMTAPVVEDVVTVSPAEVSPKADKKAARKAAKAEAAQKAKDKQAKKANAKAEKKAIKKRVKALEKDLDSQIKKLKAAKKALRKAR